VRCHGVWHVVEVRSGRIVLHEHTDEERRRERTLRALGGAAVGCFAAEQAWDRARGRLPRKLRAHRGDLWRRLQHGGDREVFALLEAGFHPLLRDGRGRTLMHYVRSFDHDRLLPLLLAAGLDVDDRDNEGATPLFIAVKERWPARLITALLDAGADPHAPGPTADWALLPYVAHVLAQTHRTYDEDYLAALRDLRERS
jgi:hypothetical protein